MRRRVFLLSVVLLVATVPITLAVLARRPSPPSKPWVRIEYKDEATGQRVKNAAMTRYVWHAYPLLGKIEKLPYYLRGRQRLEQTFASDGVFSLDVSHWSDGEEILSFHASAEGYESKSLVSYAVTWKEGQTNTFVVSLNAE
jgi:hypothetical protein